MAWRKGCRADRADSKAEQLFDERHWPDLRCVIIVASAAEKETPSTEGMQRSVATSPFLTHRAEAVAEPRLLDLQKAFRQRNFERFGELTMRDSNSFHATCLDTFPPIFYLNEVSKRAITCVHAFNAAQKSTRAAYTFDAGRTPWSSARTRPPRTPSRRWPRRASWAPTLAAGPPGPTKRPRSWRGLPREPALDALLEACGDKRGGATMMYLTRVGGGAAAVADSARTRLHARRMARPRRGGGAAARRAAAAARVRRAARAPIVVAAVGRRGLGRVAPRAAAAHILARAPHAQSPSSPPLASRRASHSRAALWASGAQASARSAKPGVRAGGAPSPRMEQATWFQPPKRRSCKTVSSRRSSRSAGSPPPAS